MVRRGVEPTINAISTIILAVTTIAILIAYRLREERAD
jgi:ABC-type spermidine/putrescine transport system permease subunit II